MYANFTCILGVVEPFELVQVKSSLPPLPCYKGWLHGSTVQTVQFLSAQHTILFAGSFEGRPQECLWFIPCFFDQKTWIWWVRSAKEFTKLFFLLRVSHSVIWWELGVAANHYISSTSFQRKCCFWREAGLWSLFLEYYMIMNMIRSYMQITWIRTIDGEMVCDACN